MEFRAEPARPHDLGGVLELLRQTGLPETGVAEHLAHFVVVRDEGRVVGIGGLEIHGDDGVLRSIAVSTGFRGQGLGVLLVDAVLDLARLNDLKRVYLLTTTFRDYFEKRGFTEVPRDSAPKGIQASWEFETGCPTTSALLMRTLHERR